MPTLINFVFTKCPHCGITVAQMVCRVTHQNNFFHPFQLLEGGIKMFSGTPQITTLLMLDMLTPIPRALDAITR